MSFTPLSPDDQDFDVSAYNRLAQSVSQRQSGSGVGMPYAETGAGTSGWMPGDVSKMFFIQLTAVTTVASGTVPVVPAYSWQEAVRVNGAFTTPGDGRSGGAATFPAFDTQMSATVTLNAGSTTSAYLACLSWDEKSVEFVGASSGSPTGIPMSSLAFSGAKYSPTTSPYALAGANPLYFNNSIYDTAGYFATLDFSGIGGPANVGIFKITTAGYYTVRLEAQFFFGAGTSGAASLGVRKGTFPVVTPTTDVCAATFFYDAAYQFPQFLTTTTSYFAAGEYICAIASAGKIGAFLGTGGGSDLIFNTFGIEFKGT